MEISTCSISGDDTSQALAELASVLTAQQREAAFVFAFFGCDHDAAMIQTFLAKTFPQAAFLGGSSSGGVIDQSATLGPGSIGLMLIMDENGDFGAASAPKTGDLADESESLLRRAISRAGCEGELPDLVWIYQAPGDEEAVIEGLKRVVGNRCPIVGGSAADNDLSGRWSQIGPDGALSQGLVVAALFPSGETGIVFQGGYEPMGKSGQVTATSRGPETPTQGAAGRVLHMIDGRPAAQVYNDWIGGGLEAEIKDGGSVLAKTTKYPLGLETGVIDGVKQYLLIHPEEILADGSLTTFADIPSGSEVVCMVGDTARLVARAGSVAEEAATQRHPAGKPAGAMVVYCAGCRMAIGEQDRDLPAQISDGLGGAPFLGCFTFGEQGPMDGRNMHGNLMISAVVFH
ncbi:MAG: FIST N-terminal domain-containing protein [Pseudomonadota bacterium]